MLYDLQAARIKKMLAPSDAFEWKVLILDKRGQDTIAPILRLNDLRDLGVVLYLPLEGERGHIKEVKAVYLVEETEDNVELIKRDVVKGFYGEYEINFTGTLRRPLLESLALEAGRAGCGRQISALRDMFVSISVLQDSLFTLNLPDSFGRTRDHKDRIVEGLLSLFATLDDVPVIQGLRGEDAEHIASSLSKRMLSLGKGSREKSLRKRKRPLLILVDRAFDIVRPVEHVWTYNALIAELLSFDLNKVVIDEKKRTDAPNELLSAIAGAQEKKESVFDLSQSDYFWRANQNEYFPVAAENIEKELERYRADLALRSIDNKSSKEAIERALSKVPELSNRNKVIYTHMEISLSIVDQIKKHFLDEFFSIEHEGALNSAGKEEVLELAEKGSATDVLRMCIVLLQKFPKERGFVVGLAKKKGCDLGVLEYFLRHGSLGEGDSGFYSGVVSAAGSVLRNIKKILPARVKLPVNSLVDKVLSDNRRGITEDLFTVDPVAEKEGTERHAVALKDVSEVVVFFLGGGTFTEFKSILESEDDVGVKLLCGATEILSASSFLAQVKREQAAVHK